MPSRIYVCPDDIAKLFDSPDTEADGMKQAVDWLKTLDIQVGDNVWLQRIGWTEKIEHMVQ